MGSGKLPLDVIISSVFSLFCEISCVMCSCKEQGAWRVGCGGGGAGAGVHGGCTRVSMMRDT